PSLLLSQHRKAGEFIDLRLGIEQDDVVALCVRGPKAKDPLRRQPIAAGEFLVQILPLRVQLARGVAVLGMIENAGKASTQVPGGEKEGPVDVLGDLGDRNLSLDATSEEIRGGNVHLGPVTHPATGARVDERI